MKEQQPPPRPGSFRRGVMYTGAGSAGNIVFLFLETMIAVRLLASESYGVFVLLLAAVNFLVIGIDFGCKTATTKLIASSDPGRQAALANTALVFRLAVVAVVAAIIWLVRDALVLLDPSGTVVAYAAFIPLMLVAASLDELLLSILQGFQAYRHMAVAQIVRSLLRLCLTVIFLSVLQLGVMGLVFSWVLSFGASISYLYSVIPIPKRFIFRRPLLGEMLRFGLPLQLTRFLWFGFYRVHVLLLGTLAGPVAVAYYDVAARIPDAFQRLSESYLAVYFPSMASLIAGGKRSQASQMLNQSLRLMSFAVALVALVAVLFSQQIVTLLFSERYAASSVAFALLMVALQMTFVVNLMGYTLTAAGHSGRSLTGDSIRAALNILGDLLLIPIFGILGPAYATLVSGYVTNPVAVMLLRRSGMAVAVASYAKQTILLLLCVAIYWLVLPTTLAAQVAIVTVFLGLNLALSTISPRDLNLVVAGRIAENA